MGDERDPAESRELPHAPECTSAHDPIVRRPARAGKSPKLRLIFARLSRRGAPPTQKLKTDIQLSFGSAMFDFA
ncbi:MAG TPA: hypothetical protein VHV51_21885, partial [Polyangiaceae bacterium]|nr:hypothetical protein [Polyangiaceae bacterium]